ncbi:MAG: undecaprenyl-diphosphate phosphatase [Clostridium sp.]|nr:undecaprenyl-diphosphate phosphatase [Clostridium sp.]
MDSIQAIILGLVQGLSEYLPISSSGHLEIFKQILGLDLEAGASLEFSVMLHVATVLSTIVVLWKEFAPLCKSFFTFKNDANTRYVLKILLSCIPVGIVGVVFKKDIEGFFGGNLMVVGICLLITAALLTFCYFFRTNPFTAKSYTPRDITWLDAFIIGVSQAVAVLPGLSRSGTTIATGVIIGDDREKVAQFSFFMVIIPILGEALLDIAKMATGSTAEAAQMDAIGLAPMLMGFLAAFISGCFACKWMLSIVKKGKLVWFAVYCAIAAIFCICFS